jgi:hypothetical protein
MNEATKEPDALASSTQVLDGGLAALSLIASGRFGRLGERGGGAGADACGRRSKMARPTIDKENAAPKRARSMRS